MKNVDSLKYLNEDFSVKSTETKQQIMYTINSGSDEIKLILYKAAGGVYTISPNTGKNPEKSLLIAEAGLPSAGRSVRYAA